MQKTLGILANIAALAGVLICLLSGLIRLAGQYHWLGYELQSLFVTGIGIMVLACLLKLYQQDAR